MPEEWRAGGRALGRLNERAPRGRIDDRLAPDANEEYFLYQTLVGAWPLETVPHRGMMPTSSERIQDYMLKALHEAKVHTSWINPNAEYDEAVQRICRPHPR